MERLDMPQWQRLGLDASLNQVLADVRARLLDERPLHEYADRAAANELAVMRRYTAGLLGVLGFETSSGGPDWRTLMREACHLAVEYFFGDWRDSYRWIDDTLFDRRRCRTELPWFRTYRYGLLCGLAVDEEEPLRRLITWPTEDPPMDTGETGHKREDLALYAWLSEWMRGQHLSPDHPLRGLILNGRGRRPKLLLRVADDLAAGDAHRFSQALSEWLQYFRRSEFDRTLVSETISIDGSILWHVARRHDLALPDLSRSDGDLLLAGL